MSDDEPTSNRALVKQLRQKCKDALRGVKDKAKQKEITDEYEALEKGLKAKPAEIVPVVTSIEWSVKESAIPKSVKSRLDKEAKDSQRRKAIDHAHRDDEKYGREEMESIVALLRQEQLVIESIPSDGSCLFNSIARNIPAATADQTRKLCVDYIRMNPIDFAPFIECDISDYLNQLEHNAWGGELELVALSKTLKRPIHVFRKSGKIIIGESDAPPLRVSFHEYLFSEPHYNAVLAK